MAETDSYIYSAEVKADTGVALNLTSYWGWNTWLQAGHEGKAVDCNGEWKKVEIKTSNQASYDTSNYFSTASTGAKEYCIKNVVIYKVLSDADMPEIKPATVVTLSKENEVVANTTITYEDGKAKCAFEADSSGHGVRWKLNGATGIDLSKYKVVVNYEGANTENPYGMCLQLESNDGVVGDWWGHNATAVSKDKPMYTSTDASGAGKWEITGDSGMAYQIFIKYNTWVSSGDARTDAAEFTITSIDIVEK